MHALPFLIALALAALLAPAMLRALQEGGPRPPTPPRRELPFPFGVLVLAAALLALIPLLALERLASSDLFHREILAVLLYAPGVLALALIAAPPAPRARERGAGGEQPRPERGWRGHAAALR